MRESIQNGHGALFTGRPVETWEKTWPEQNRENDRNPYYLRWFKGVVRSALAHRLPVPVEVTDSLGWKPRAWQKSRAELLEVNR